MAIYITPGPVPTATEGAVYYDSTTKILKVYSGTRWLGVDATLATGGNDVIIYTSGGITYRVHIFLSSGTFTAVSAITSVDYLVIAGGGGGGGTNVNGGGGGGAGGYRNTVTSESQGGLGTLDTPLSLSAVDYAIIVGGGGAGGSTGANGVDSSIIGGSGGTAISITAVGGGGGAPAGTGGSGGVGLLGGSGSGGGRDSGTSSGGAGTANQGFAGGASGGSSASSAGGGGGAGAEGENGTTPDGTANYYIKTYIFGDGGAGLSSSITGVLVWRAGGGGGAHEQGDDGTTATPAIDNHPQGGVGGGGDGSTLYSQSAAGINAPTPGADNTGGGGGAGNGTFAGQKGGSGIVIIRYAI